MNEPRHGPLHQVLTEEAERAIPENIDLWPEVAHRLRAREQTVTSQRLTGRSTGHLHDPQRHVSTLSRGWRRPGELSGNLVSFGWGALVILIIAIAFGLPGRGNGPVRFAAGTPAPVSSSPTQGAREPSSAFVDCTFDLDVSPESIADRVVISIEAISAGGCEEASALNVALVNAKGERPQIAGSPMSLPLRANDKERRTAVALEWSNWCDRPDRLKIEVRFGSERHTLPLSEAPRCADRQRPSTLRVTPRSPASTTSVTPVP